MTSRPSLRSFTVYEPHCDCLHFHLFTPCRLGPCLNLFLGKNCFSPSQNTNNHGYIYTICLFVSAMKYHFMCIISRMCLLNVHDNRLLLQPHTHTHARTHACTHTHRALFWYNRCTDLHILKSSSNYIF